MDCTRLWNSLIDGPAEVDGMGSTVAGSTVAGSTVAGSTVAFVRLFLALGILSAELFLLGG